ncbi:MAG: L-histidine N(alpha)-methyltransferase [Pyrinomonadaceae bacterium]
MKTVVAQPLDASASGTSLADDKRFVVHNLLRGDYRAEFERDVRAGLSARPKKLFPKYFYDQLGSQLFEAICLLPEYYLSRAEDEIFANHADEIVAAVAENESGGITLLEMGSGSASKSRRIIESLLQRQPELVYVPVDISASALERSSRVLLQSFTELRVEAFASDYYDALAALGAKDSSTLQGRTLALFLGSNIGNFDATEARTFLRRLRGVLRAGDMVLLGADLKKDVRALEAAYDDALGITAAFNLNLLVRINRELDADFEPRRFQHHSFYNEEIGRVEIHAESRVAQVAHIRKLEMEVSFAAGERVHTENSYKYDLKDLSQLAIETGFTRARTWLDSREQFSSNLFLATSEGSGGDR